MTGENDTRPSEAINQFQIKVKTKKQLTPLKTIE